MLDDVPSLNAILNNTLLKRPLVADDNQLLSGNGTSQDLSGINNAGNLTASTGAAIIDIEQIVQAIAQLAVIFARRPGLS